MSRQEILATRFCEMQDMISCLSIYEGDAEPKTKTTGRYTDFEAALKLR